MPRAQDVVEKPVLFVGWRGKLPTWRGGSIPLPLDNVFRKLSGDCHAIVLGADAIENLDIPHAAHMLKLLRAPVFLCCESCKPPAVAEWVKRGFVDVVLPRNLVSRLESIVPAQRRAPLPVGWWAPRTPAPGTDGEFAATAVCHLSPLTVDAWQRRLGWTHARLAKVCRTHFSATPKQMLSCHFVSQYRIFAYDGATDEQLALLFGYHDGSTLRRALRRAETAARKVGKPLAPWSKKARSSGQNGPVQPPAPGVS